jgi:RNA polymerase sigma-70 factor (ECF subfamily)
MNHKAEPSPNDSRPEQTLVVAAKNGNEQALEILFKRHQRRVLAIVRRYVRIREDAEDIAQQTFQKAYIHLREFQGESSFSTWLTRIAINEALMFLRRVGAKREVSIDSIDGADRGPASLEISDSDANPETRYSQREDVQVLSKALGNLRPGLRSAISLCELAEFSTSETARRMGLSVGTVKARVFRGKRQLRQEFFNLRSQPRPGRGITRRIPQPRLCNAPGF